MSDQDTMYKRMFRVDAWIAQRGLCAYCFCPVSRDACTADHIRARDTGGATTRDNIQAACKACNSLKGTRSADAFKKLIKGPPEQAGIPVLMANARRRIGLRCLRAERRILKFAGMA